MSCNHYTATLKSDFCVWAKVAPLWNKSLHCWGTHLSVRIIKPGSTSLHADVTWQKLTPGQTFYPPFSAAHCLTAPFPHAAEVCCFQKVWEALHLLPECFQKFIIIFIFFALKNNVTSFIEIFFEKLIVCPLLKKTLAFYVTWRFIPSFYKTLPLILMCGRTPTAPRQAWRHEIKTQSCFIYDSDSSPHTEVTRVCVISHLL
jgi:hypothetical protein